MWFCLVSVAQMIIKIWIMPKKPKTKDDPDGEDISDMNRISPEVLKKL